jgi:hypothetical protein
MTGVCHETLPHRIKLSGLLARLSITSVGGGERAAECDAERKAGESSRGKGDVGKHEPSPIFRVSAQFFAPASLAIERPAVGWAWNASVSAWPQVSQ